MTDAVIEPDEANAPPAYLPPGGRQREHPRGAVVHDALTFAALDGYHPLQLDVFVPADATGPVPCVVYIHGGAWLFGSRELPPYFGAPTNMFQAIVDAGFAVASIDYRHSREAPFPAQLHDGKAALRYLRGFASELGIDPDRFALWGDSAGGHLAALVALIDDPALEGRVGVRGPSSTVTAVVDFFGVGDVDEMPSFLDSAPPEWVAELRAAGGDLPAEPIDILLVGSPLPEDTARRTLSPVTHIRADSPPFFFVHGEDDVLVPIGQSELMLDALTSAGVEASLTRVPGAGHGLPEVDGTPYVAAAITFLQEQFRGQAV